jgi:hypothetical protein
VKLANRKTFGGKGTNKPSTSGNSGTKKPHAGRAGAGGTVAGAAGKIGGGNKAAKKKKRKGLPAALLASLKKSCKEGRYSDGHPGMWAATKYSSSEPSPTHPALSPFGCRNDHSRIQRLIFAIGFWLHNSEQ